MRTKKKGIILLLGLFTVLMTMLFGVGATSASAQELCTHNYVGTTHIATCTEQGYTEYVCSECGDTYKDDFVEPYGHTYTEVVVEPTCTMQGFTTHYCVDCGYQYSDNYIPAKGHNYSETVFEPTCTEYGYTLHTCTECKASYKDNIVERLGHDYAEDVKEATCLEGGYTTFTCSRCGDSYVGNETEAKGHTYVDNVVGVTCTSYGFTEHICSECNDRYVDSYVAPAGHKYVDVVVPATETQIGYTKHTCEVCGYVYLSDFSESKDDGYVEVPDVEQPPVHEHSYTVEATIDRINRKVNITAVCDCGENGNDNVSVVFVNDSGESTTVLPVDGVADYSFLAEENYDVSIIDEKGNVKIEPQYIVATNFLSGVALVAYEKNDEMTISIIGSNGKTVYTFDQGIRPLSWEYSDGLLAVIDTVGKIGFIDTRGKIAIKPAEELKLCQPLNPANIPYTFKNGRCIYYDGEHYGLLDRNGNIAVPAQYKTIYLGEGGLFAVENTRNEWGCIDGDGNTVLPFEYVTGEIRPSIDAHAIVVQNESGRYKIVNEQGKTISHLTFSQYQSKYYNL